MIFSASDRPAMRDAQHPKSGAQNSKANAKNYSGFAGHGRAAGRVRLHHPCWIYLGDSVCQPDGY